MEAQLKLRFSRASFTMDEVIGEPLQNQRRLS
jgi:hypothetical protein